MHIQAATIERCRRASHFLCAFPHNLSPDAQRLPQTAPTIFPDGKNVLRKSKDPRFSNFLRRPRCDSAYFPKFFLGLVFSNRLASISSSLRRSLVKRSDTRRTANETSFFNAMYVALVRFATRRRMPPLNQRCPEMSSTDFFPLTIPSSRKREGESRPFDGFSRRKGKT